MPFKMANTRILFLRRRVCGGSADHVLDPHASKLRYVPNTLHQPQSLLNVCQSYTSKLYLL